MTNINNIFNEMLFQLKNNLLDKWYPKVIDNENGGYFSNLSHDFQLAENQEKMIVTQARHIWTLSKAAEFFNDEKYCDYAVKGFHFIKDKMWDNINGGFFQIRNREGKFSDVEGWRNEKRVYGNAYGLFGLSSLYKININEEILSLANDTFNWIEEIAHDKVNRGYFQFFTEENTIINNSSLYKSNATDSVEIGYKDQNSSIHLLEAFTEFYSVSKSSLVRSRLEEMLILIRDTITTSKGYLNLFFTDDWEAISFREAQKEVRESNYRLDHVSFGHDYETAFLMLEASHALNIDDDIKTLETAKRMVDHALENGWDNERGGFFDEGYYFLNDDKCSIIKYSKNWWAQAEALNIFLLMSKIFPNEEKYNQIFVKVWEYIKQYLIDDENGGWYWGGIDKEPEKRLAPKGEIWKATYHNGRALMNCIAMLSSENELLHADSPGIKKKSDEMNELIEHWKTIAKNN